MADLNALNLNDEGITDLDFENMPETIGGNRIPPQPGIYRFAMPAPSVVEKCFDRMVTSDQDVKLVAIFQDAAALRNVTLNEFYGIRVNNRTRIIKIKKVDTIVSDMGMLLKALGVRPVANARGLIDNNAYGQALIAAGNKEFMAEHSLTANCNPNRDIYKDGALQRGVMGCGLRYAVKGYPGKNGKPDVITIPKEFDDMGRETTKIATRFTCRCGAVVSCWNDMRSYRPAV